MASDLLPCAFCGSSAAFRQVNEPDTENDGGYYIECDNALCGATSTLMFAIGEDPKPLLVERWNRRVTPASDDSSRIVAMLREAGNGLEQAIIDAAKSLMTDNRLTMLQRKEARLGDQWEVLIGPANDRKVHGVYASRAEGQAVADAIEQSVFAKAITAAIATYIEGHAPPAANESEELGPPWSQAATEFCQAAYEATGGPTPELERAYQAYLNSQARQTPSDHAEPTPDLLRWRGAFKGMPNLDEDPSDDTPTRDELIEVLTWAMPLVDIALSDNEERGFGPGRGVGLYDDETQQAKHARSVLARTRRG